LTKFLDGPAAGVVLSLRRAPIFLRVVRNKLARSQEKAWDALDQVDDTCKPREEVVVYVRAGEATMVHVCARPRGSGWYAMAQYKMFDPQPSPDDVFLNEDWQAWCYKQAAELQEQQATGH
jgi:hypothetical protein